MTPVLLTGHDAGVHDLHHHGDAEVAMGLAFSLVPAVLAVLSIAALRRYEEPEVGHAGR